LANQRYHLIVGVRRGKITKENSSSITLVMNPPETKAATAAFNAESLKYALAKAIAIAKRLGGAL
jgi:hypothetical protein